MRAPEDCGWRSRRIGERKRTEWLYAAEMETLRMNHRRRESPNILTHVCASIDRTISPSITTILLMDPDGQRLWRLRVRKCPKSGRARSARC